MLFWCCFRHLSSIWVRTKPYLRWIEPLRMTGSDRKWRQSVSRSMLCACATGSYVISALVWPFDRKWQSRNRKRHCPEVVLTGSRFCACPIFSHVFFLVVVTWLPDVTNGHLTSFGVPLDVRLRNTRSDRRPRDPFGGVLGVFSTTSES